MIPSILLALCLVFATIALFIRVSKALFAFAAVGSTAIFGIALWLGVPALMGAAVVSGNGFWYIDALSALMIILIGFVQWSGMLVSISYLSAELHEGEITPVQSRRYVALLFAFVFSMLLSVISNNLGIMWVALEATTLSTTLLVAFYMREGSLEAAWKYLILCSTGITLGLLGLMITYYAATTGNVLAGLAAMQWTDLALAAHAFSPQLMRIAFAFILVGFGTKVGLVPMHTWLPDAHSRAPAPISAMLSGVLLNAALFAIIRYKILTDTALGGNAWTSAVLLVFGVLSVVVPAAFIIVQHDYKRLLAYSSIEHMGLVVFSLAFGGFGALIALIHMIGHALIKSMLFFGAGNILQRFKSTKFENVQGVMRVLPYTGGLMLAGVFLLLATPPSPLFMSEYLLISRGLFTHPYSLTAVLLALALIAAGFIRFFLPMLFGTPHASHDPRHGEEWGLSHFVMFLHLALACAFGAALWMSGGYVILERIAAIII